MGGMGHERVGGQENQLRKTPCKTGAPEASLCYWAFLLPMPINYIKFFFKEEKEPRIINELLSMTICPHRVTCSGM